MQLQYIVIEIQTIGETLAVLSFQFDTLHEAEAKYHSILAGAAVSTLPMHSAALLTNAGTLVKSEYYDHTVAPEPEMVP